jgi:archaemetzincin
MRLLFLSFTIGIATIMVSCQSADIRDIVIGILPFGDFSKNDVSLVQDALALEFGNKIVVLPSRSIPRRFFINIKSPRYRADSLIAYLAQSKPDSIDVIIGLTNDDISVSKREEDGSIKKPEAKYADFGVFGYGYVSAPGAVVSAFRIRSALYHDRLIKIAVHEVGHNLGLSHCDNKKCVMTDAAEKIATVDEAGMHLCEVCKSKLAK